jgi:malate/lactate dehydrogenase
MVTVKVTIVGGARGVGASTAFNLVLMRGGHELVLLDTRPVIGYTVNDSLRFRTGLAKALGASPGSVEAWVLGEHGEL